MNIYEKFPVIENDSFRLRKPQNTDCDDLVKVYSDKNALPFFNSDSCDGDNFYYATKSKMTEILAFWEVAYNNKWFARFSIEDIKTNTVIGTVEICLRASKDAFNDMAVLRIDVGSNCEKEEILYNLFSLIVPHINNLLGTKGIITKVPIYAIERLKAVTKTGFIHSDDFLIGKQGYAYDRYFTIS